ncbi:MAG: zinc protease [Thalassolituus oleivorans]|jgi:zinc protease
MAWKLIDRALYPPGHPYRWQVIGSLQDLDAAQLEDVKQFHTSWYGPNNATLVVAGDIKVAETKAWIQHYFEEIPKAEKPERASPPSVIVSENVRLVHEDRLARLPELTLSWPTVPAYHADEPALEILAALLTDGKAAPFYKVLVEEDELAPGVSGFNFGQELAGRFSIRVRAFPNTDLDSVQTSIAMAFARFEREGVSQEQLERIKASTEAGFYGSLSSVIGKAFQLAQYSIFTGDPGFASKELPRILAVRAEDVFRVYVQYLKGKPSVATSFVPVGQGALALSGSQPSEVYEEPIVQGAEAPVQVLDRSNMVATPTEIDRSVEPEFGASPTLKAPIAWRGHGPGFTAQDLETTRSFYIRNNSGAFETLGAKLGILSDVSAYGFAPAYILDRQAVIRAMTIESVKALADRFLDPAGMVWLVVGDAETQLPRLRSLGLGDPILLQR